MTPGSSSPAHTVLADLRAIFGARLEAFVVYAPATTPRPSVALVSSLEMADLDACAARAGRWKLDGAAAPVLLTKREFERSLDAFPVEFGEIIDSHETLWGDDPFAALAVASGDLRRACEYQIRSLLLHLREDYMEAGGQARAVHGLVIDSAADFRALVTLLAKLDGRRLGGPELATWAAERLGLEARTVSDVLHVANDPDASGVDAGRLFPGYLAAVEHLARRVDEW
jgi:hypothetical protein